MQQEKIKDQQNEIKQLKEKVQSQKSDLLSINTKHDNWEVVSVIIVINFFLCLINCDVFSGSEQETGPVSRGLPRFAVAKQFTHAQDQRAGDQPGEAQHFARILGSNVSCCCCCFKCTCFNFVQSKIRVYRLQSQLHAEEPQVAKATEYKHRIGQLTQQLMMWYGISSAFFCSLLIEYTMEREQATEQHEDRKHELDLLKHRLVEYEQMSAAHVAHEHEVKASEQQATLEASDLRLRLQQLEEKDRLRDQTIHELRAAAEKQKRVMQAQIAAVDEKYRSLQHINQALEHRFVEVDTLVCLYLN